MWNPETIDESYNKLLTTIKTFKQSYTKNNSTGYYENFKKNLENTI